MIMFKYLKEQNEINFLQCKKKYTFHCEGEEVSFKFEIFNKYECCVIFKETNPSTKRMVLCPNFTNALLSADDEKIETVTQTLIV